MSQRHKLLNNTILIALILIIVGCSSNEAEPSSSMENESSTPINNEVDKTNMSALENARVTCIESNGKWIDSANECEGISQDICEENRGIFESCGSACRNNPDVEVCTMQCMMYCDFSNLEILNSSNQNSNNDSFNYDKEITDSYRNKVPDSCQTWYDGCNTCMISEDGMLACTRMMCSEESLKPAQCRGFR